MAEVRAWWCVCGLLYGCDARQREEWSVVGYLIPCTASPQGTESREAFVCVRAESSTCVRICARLLNCGGACCFTATLAASLGGTAALLRSCLRVGALCLFCVLECAPPCICMVYLVCTIGCHSTGYVGTASCGWQAASRGIVWLMWVWHALAGRGLVFFHSCSCVALRFLSFNKRVLHTTTGLCRTCARILSCGSCVLTRWRVCLGLPACFSNCHPSFFQSAQDYGQGAALVCCNCVDFVGLRACCVTMQ